MAPQLSFLSGEPVPLSALPSETVGDLRRRLATSLEVPVPGVRLLHEGGMLVNHRRVSELPDGGLITVLLRRVERSIYIAEAGSSRVTRWPLDSRSMDTVGEIVAGAHSGSCLRKLGNPRGVFVDLKGVVYVAEGSNDRVSRWLPGADEGDVIAGGAGWGDHLAQLCNPTGIYVTAEGALYVAEYWNHRVSKWVPGADGGLIVAGGHGKGSDLNQLQHPDGLFVDPAGNVYVAEYGNHRVTRWRPGATCGEVIAGGGPKSIDDDDDLRSLRGPTAVFVDDHGAVYVSEHLNHRVSRWTPGAKRGEIVAGGKGFGASAEHLAYPRSIFVDPEGTLYVSEEVNHRVSRWAQGATVGEVVAGGKGEGDRLDQLNSPFGVFVVDAGECEHSD